MRLMFDIEFNLGLLLATITAVLTTALVVCNTQPSRPMRGPGNVNLDTDDDSEDTTSEN